jgi:hypothetical protein
VASEHRPVFVQRVLLQGLAFCALILALYLSLLEITLRGLEQRAAADYADASEWQNDFEIAATLAHAAPWHVGAQDAHARIALIGAQRFVDSQQAAMAVYAQARTAAERSVALRPNWAPSWLNLAIAEFVLDANSDAWKFALGRALALQERTIRHQIALAKFRKRAERNLPSALQVQLQRAAISAVLDYPAEYIEAVRRLSRAQWACPPNSPMAQRPLTIDFDPDLQLSAAQRAALEQRCR